MKRLMENTVFSGLVTAWRFATWPTSRSPDLVKPTTDGVSRPAFRIGDDHRFATLHDRNDGVRGAQVDPDNLAHNSLPLR